MAYYIVALKRNVVQNIARCDLTFSRAWVSRLSRTVSCSGWIIREDVVPNKCLKSVGKHICGNRRKLLTFVLWRHTISSCDVHFARPKKEKKVKEVKDGIGRTLVNDRSELCSATYLKYHYFMLIYVRVVNARVYHFCFSTHRIDLFGIYTYQILGIKW